MNFLELLVELGTIVVRILLVAVNILLLYPFPAPAGRIKRSDCCSWPERSHSCRVIIAFGHLCGSDSVGKPNFLKGFYVTEWRRKGGSE